VTKVPQKGGGWIVFLQTFNFFLKINMFLIKVQNEELFCQNENSSNFGKKYFFLV